MNKLVSGSQHPDHLVRCAVEGCDQLGLREDVCPMCFEYRCPKHASHGIVLGGDHPEGAYLIDPSKPEGEQRQCMACMQGPQRLGKATAAEHAQGVTDGLDQLREALGATEGRRQLALVMLARFKEEVELLDTLDASPLERIVWATMIGRKLDRYLRPQVEVHDRQGKYIVRVDFASTLLKVAIFTDGRTYHSKPEDVARDKEHNRRLKEMGWEVRRYWTEEVNDDHSRLIDETYQLTCERLLQLQRGELK